VTPELFRERFALATFADGGVLVDLQTGSYSRVNAAGAAIFEEVERARGTDDAIAAVAQRLGIDLSTATNHVGAMLTALAGEGVRREPLDPFRYRPAADGGYDVWHDATRVLHVHEGGRLLTLASPPETLPLRIYDYVSGIAPKLLYLRGVTVMHGSSCMRGDALLGICGKSRAGKTTTARTFARHGCSLMSEDLLVFDPDLSKARIFVDGEKTVDRWAHEAAAALAAGDGSTADTEGLMSAASGDTVPLRTLWFLDAARRGERFEVRTLGRTRTLELVVANHFLGAGGTGMWRRHLATSHTIAGSVGACELDLPNGLDRLDEAIGRYTTNSAS
jgi:hypothetical protein